MGGGYTVVLERARLDAEAAADELAAKRRERQLYFMSDDDDDREGETAERGDFGEGGAFERLRRGKENASEKKNRRCPEGAAGALRGWAPGPGDDERSSSGLSARGRSGAGSLPPPRGVTSRGVSAEAPSSSGGGGEPTTTLADDAAPRRSTLGGTRASARLSMIHAGGSAPSATSRAPGSFARGATPGLLR
jgi:hypothetical protein